MSQSGARERIDAEAVSVPYLRKVMRRLFPRKNDCAKISDLNEVVEELQRFGICTNKELRLFLKKHRKALLAIDKTPLNRMHQKIYREMLGDTEYLDSIRRQYWFCYPGLVRTAMEIEFGEEYEQFSAERDST